ncbi:hypothetical protein KSS87_016972, partial [Heliosperma pusillum]
MTYQMQNPELNSAKSINQSINYRKLSSITLNCVIVSINYPKFAKRK